MNLSPTARTLLTVFAAGLGAFAAILPTLEGVPTWPGVLVGVCAAMLGALGIVPPQVGGTQQGVVNPSVVEPPAANVDEAGYAEGGLVFFVLILLVIVIFLKAVTGSWLVFLLLLLIVLAFLF